MNNAYHIKTGFTFIINIPFIRCFSSYSSLFQKNLSAREGIPYRRKCVFRSNTENFPEKKVKRSSVNLNISLLHVRL